MKNDWHKFNSQIKCIDFSIDNGYILIEDILNTLRYIEISTKRVNSKIKDFHINFSVEWSDYGLKYSDKLIVIYL